MSERQYCKICERELCDTEEWTPIKNRRPPFFKKVLTYGYGVGFNICTHDGTRFVAAGSFCDSPEKYTHWMPIPPTPGGINDE